MTIVLLNVISYSFNIMYTIFYYLKNLLPNVIYIGTYDNTFDFYLVKKGRNYVKVGMIKGTFDYRVIQYVFNQKDNIILCELVEKTKNSFIKDVTNNFLSVSYYYRYQNCKKAIHNYLIKDTVGTSTEKKKYLNIDIDIRYYCHCH